MRKKRRFEVYLSKQHLYLSNGRGIGKMRKESELPSKRTERGKSLLKRGSRINAILTKISFFSKQHESNWESDGSERPNDEHISFSAEDSTARSDHSVKLLSPDPVFGEADEFEEVWIEAKRDTVLSDVSESTHNTIERKPVEVELNHQEEQSVSVPSVPLELPERESADERTPVQATAGASEEEMLDSGEPEPDSRSVLDAGSAAETTPDADIDATIRKFEYELEPEIHSELVEPNLAACERDQECESNAVAKPPSKGDQVEDDKNDFIDPELLIERPRIHDLRSICFEEKLGIPFHGNPEVLDSWQATEGDEWERNLSHPLQDTPIHSDEDMSDKHTKNYVDHRNEEKNQEFSSERNLKLISEREMSTSEMENASGGEVHEPKPHFDEANLNEISSSLAFAHSAPSEKIVSNSKFKKLNYSKTKRALQLECVKLQRSVIKNRERVVIIFEGLELSGKFDMFRVFTEFMDPRSARLVSLNERTSEEQDDWYFQRYTKHLPKPGEIVFFDRGWYERGVAEPIHGLCTEEEYGQFLIQAPEFEYMLLENGYKVIKIWLSVSKKKQKKRLKAAVKDPLLNWNTPPFDGKYLERWKNAHKYRDLMFSWTSKKYSPWTVVDANKRKKARLETMRFVLSRLDYEGKDDTKVSLVPNGSIVKKFHRSML